jgi:hypothetical protein
MIEEDEQSEEPKIRKPMGGRRAGSGRKKTGVQSKVVRVPNSIATEIKDLFKQQPRGRTRTWVLKKL